jgi:hypothetical protein
VRLDRRKDVLVVHSFHLSYIFRVQTEDEKFFRSALFKLALIGALYTSIRCFITCVGISNL